MLIYPSIDELMRKVGSKYSLVVAASKRARELMEMEQKPVNGKVKKPVTIALEEMLQGVISAQPPSADEE
ncbi:MAG: DNA-directed RNA polymerase subunit omega [Bacillota bacterium]|jgi:DNA-directed RNA polymerase subunit omega